MNKDREIPDNVNKITMAEMLAAYTDTILRKGGSKI